MNRKISVLFTMPGSVYESLGADCWDEKRDARKWPGGGPVVAHPPCRTWGKLSHFANAPADEHSLALFAVDQVRRWGGVLEHPYGSRLWPEYLPLPGRVDLYGGFSVCVDQFWWGHKAVKKTMLYVCGSKEKDLPLIPLRLDAVQYVVSTARRLNKKGVFVRSSAKKEITKRERLATPPAFAGWLLEVAAMCDK